MSSEKPTPERIVVDFPKTEIADEKTRRSVLRLALPLVLLPHVAQEFWLHSLLQRRQYGGRPPLGDHRLPSLLDSLAAHHSKRRGTAVTRPSAPRSTSAFSDDEAELIQIDENLVRANLSDAERILHVARRKELYEKLHPETKHGGDRRSAGARSSSQNENLKAFVADIAVKTGKDQPACHPFGTCSWG